LYHQDSDYLGGFTVLYKRTKSSKELNRLSFLFDKAKPWFGFTIELRAFHPGSQVIDVVHGRELLKGNGGKELVIGQKRTGFRGL